MSSGLPPARRSTSLQTSSTEEIADQYFAAQDYLARQGALIGWLLAQENREAAGKVILAVGQFLLHFPPLMREDLIYTYHRAWTEKYLELSDA